MPATPIQTPAHFAPLHAIAYGEAEATPVSRRSPLPVRAGSGLSLQERLLREGTQVTAGYMRGDNLATSYTAGQYLGAINIPVGRATWVSAVTVSSTKDVILQLLISNTGLIANNAAVMNAQVPLGPGYGACAATLPIQRFLAEGETVAATLRTAVAQSAAGDFLWSVALDGRQVCSDFFLDAPRTMLVIGDSLSCSTILGPKSYGSDFWHARLARHLFSAGKPIRRVLKGDGGWKTSHAVTALRAGVLDIGPVDVIAVMLGTNETSASEYSANLATLIDWKTVHHPRSEMVFVSPPPRADAYETTLMPAMRSALASSVTAVADPTITLVDTSGAYANTAANLPDNVHMVAAAQSAVGDRIWETLNVSGVAERL